MSDILPDPTHVRAAANAIGWRPVHGFLYDPAERDQLVAAGRLILDVNDDGVIDHVEGAAPLAAVIRLDREITSLYQRLWDAIEHASETFIAR